MILILPRHYLIYDPDSSPSCTVLYMILILPRHCLIYMTKNNWNLSFIHYFFILPFIFYIVWQFSPYGEESGYSLNSWWEKKNCLPHFILYYIIMQHLCIAFCYLSTSDIDFTLIELTKRLTVTVSTSDWTNTTNSRIFCLLCIWNVFTYEFTH